jgi:hypothetical protein
LVSLVATIRTRPAAYLGGEPSLERLGLFIAAFRWGRESARAGSGSVDDRILEDFARWLAVSEAEANMKRWLVLVNERAARDGRDDRLAVFFELFTAFSNASNPTDHLR